MVVVTNDVFRKVCTHQLYLYYIMYTHVLSNMEYPNAGIHYVHPARHIES